MLKRSILVLALCLFIASPALAKNVGIANMKLVGATSEPSIAAQKTLTARLGKEGAALDKEAQALQKRNVDLQAQAATMTKEAISKKQQAIITSARALEEKRRAFAQKVQTEENKMRQALAAIIMPASEKIAKQKKFDLILDSGLGVVLYSVESIDVTEAILKEVNARWKAQGSKFK